MHTEKTETSVGQFQEFLLHTPMGRWTSLLVCLFLFIVLVWFLAKLDRKI